ncbi:hypothetical protein H6P81_019782 [Aristolochia fimbriata]|uniref:F-box domain-containing protein n=1 Tax=Aristolochia fimbriata TaxID=158543 RepID=A0AAV7DWM1_ARIFI|nr:hypothetical protein H6P81_019782 [Aristolochia fimbriata]
MADRMQSPLKPFSFLGFGSGPRMCPGINLAKLEICVFIHHLVCRYQWKPLEQDDTIYPTLVRMPKNNHDHHREPTATINPRAERLQEAAKKRGGRGGRNSKTAAKRASFDGVPAPPPPPPPQPPLPPRPQMSSPPQETAGDCDVSPMERLPADALYEIFVHLSLPEILLCRSVCKLFHRTLTSPPFLGLLRPLPLLAIRDHVSPLPALSRPQPPGESVA